MTARVRDKARYNVSVSSALEKMSVFFDTVSPNNMSTTYLDVS